MKKIYSDDRNVSYKGTKLKAIETKSDIDAILAKWGITKVMWEYDPENNHVEITFQLPYEKFGDSEINPIVKLEPPRIWNKTTSGKKVESINWRISMRILYWFIRNTLQMSYAMSSEKAVAFLPYIQTGPDQSVKDVVIPKICNAKQLPKPVEVEPKTEEPVIVDADFKEVRFGDD